MEQTLEYRMELPNILMPTISEEKKSLFRRFRRWVIVQKYTLARGYGHMNILMLGFLVAVSIRSVIPGLINTTWKFILLVVMGFIGLYIVGWFDKKLGFLNQENNYATENTSLMMEAINDIRKSKLKSKEEN